MSAMKWFSSKKIILFFPTVKIWKIYFAPSKVRLKKGSKQTNEWKSVRAEIEIIFENLKEFERKKSQKCHQ